MHYECSTCCAQCKAHEHALAGTSTNSLESLFGAGTVTIAIDPSVLQCAHQHAGDGWHTLVGIPQKQSCVTKEDVRIIEAITFLVRSSYIAVTYRTTAREFILRIYLVPLDNPYTRPHRWARDEQPVRRHLRILLRRVSRSRLAWDGEPDATFIPFLPENNDDRSLVQIFSDLSSADSDGLNTLPEIPYLRSQLYDYQKESLGAMLRREESNAFFDDPLYIRVEDMRGRVLFLQPATLAFHMSCPKIFRSQGGFLCEELGTGKTVMILALILSTLDTLARPSDDASDNMLTPLSLRVFPYYQTENVANLVYKERKQPSLPNFPSLVEIVCDYSRRNPEKIDLRSHEEALDDRHLWRPIMNNAPFYLYDDSVFKEVSSRRQQEGRLSVRFLTTATLIVVPKTLQAQWASEIMKHCTSSVRTLVITQKTVIPPASKLASDYDVVLIRDTRISQLYSENATAGMSLNYICNCPSYSRIRIPDCNCKSSSPIYTLMQIRWKRLIRDEGHNAASLSTNMNAILNAISAERRWIVTGTPTTNLLGLSFGLSEETRALNRPVSPQKERIPVQEILKGDLGVQDEFGPEPDSKIQSKRVWSTEDRRDLRKLADMMASFLRVLPFATDIRAFDVFVADAIFAKEGPLPGSVLVLEQLMKTYMVRHRIEDIEQCVQLPPAYEETILLDLDEYGLLSYNVILSLIAVNAVDSERRDQDYLFHPSRANSLAATIVNLSQTLFWRFDDDTFDQELAENIHRAENAILHAQERHQPAEDIKLVEDAIVHLRRALSNRTFRAMQHELEIPYRVKGASPLIQEAWGLVHTEVTEANNTTPFFMFPYYVLALRSALDKHPLAREERLAEQGRIVHESRRILEALHAENSKTSNRGSSEKQRLREDAKHERQKMMRERRSVSSKEKVAEMKEEHQRVQERLKALAEADEAEQTDQSLRGSTSDGTVVSSARDELLQQSPLAGMRIGGSCSSKLDFILQEVLAHSATEKFLIFSKEPFNLQHISEGLDMIGVKYIFFLQEKGADQQRDQWLTTFETSETFRVFLMELKYGARGLNIVSASRVIFCEPVWHADVESQAIKRVHRIGQTRPVSVKTLAIRSTFEEYMIKRQKEFKETGRKPPGLQEESGIRQYLQNPVFLEASVSNESNLDISLLRPASSRQAHISCEGSGDRVGTEEDLVVDAAEQLVELATQEYRGERTKKRLKVTFG